MEEKYLELPVIESTGLTVLKDLAKFLDVKPAALRTRLEQHNVKVFRYGRGKYLVNLEQLAKVVAGE